jgi:hypothetical protein
MSKLDKKQFLIVSIFWFIIVFVIMWVLSGACTSLFVEPALENELCITKEAVSGLSNIPILGLFLPFNPWVSLAYWFAPVAGFIFAFFTIKWWNNYFESNEATSLVFPVVLILILLIGLAVNLSWYYGEFANNSSNRNPNVDVKLYFCFENSASACNQTVNKLNTEMQQQAVSGNATSITQYIGVNYWPELRQNYLLTFIFGAIAAWKLLFFKRLYEEKSN